MNTDSVHRESSSDSDDSFNLTPEEELIYIIMSSDKETEKLDKLARLIKGGVNINYQSSTRKNNTALHIAVSKKELDIVKALLKNGADKNIRNDKGETPLNKAQGHQGIIEIFNLSFLSNLSLAPQLIQSQKENVNEKLELFIQHFVGEFETKLQVYRMVLEKDVEKTGKCAAAYSEALGQGPSAAVTGTIGYFLLGTPFLGGAVGLGSLAGKKVGGALGSVIGSSNHQKKCVALADLVYSFHKDEAGWRRKLVKAGYDLFQSYEMQFVRVSKFNKHEVAMRTLAEDASNRALYQFTGAVETSFTEAHIAKAVVSGKSKIEKKCGMPLPTAVWSARLKTPGFRTNYTDALGEKKKWNTSSLFEKVGLVIEEKFGGKKDKKFFYHKKKIIKTEKYGYRRLLLSELENWETLKDEYACDTTISEQFSDYEYFLSLENIERESQRVLAIVNRNDKYLLEDRVKEAVSDVKDELLKLNTRLKEQSDRAEEGIHVLIEENLKSLNVNDCYEEIKKAMQEGFRNVTHSIEKSSGEIKVQNEDTQRLLVSLNDAMNEDTALWFDVKPPVSSFTGREEELKEVHEALQHDGKAVVSQSNLVCQLGGLGKSELVRKYISQYSQDYDNKVVWINAGNHNTLATSFRKLAVHKLRINIRDTNGKERDIKDVVEDVYKFFSKGKSIFIFDNAEPLSMSTFSYSLPGYPSTLITSRNNTWPESVRVLNLDVFAPNEALEFIKKGVAIKDDQQEESIIKLAQTLHYFPLALQQATAYITTMDGRIDEYLDKWREKREELRDVEVQRDGDNHNPYLKITLITFDVSLDAIKKEINGDVVTEVVGTIAYLPPNNTPFELLYELTSDKKEVKSAVALLSKYSVITLAQNDASFSVHRLMQHVTKPKLEEQEIEIVKKSLKLLASAGTSSMSYVPNMYDELEQELEVLPLSMIIKLCSDVKYDEIFLRGKHVLKLLSHKLGSNSGFTLTTHKHEAQELYSRNEFDEALCIYDEVYRKQEKNLPHDHPDLLDTLSHLAFTLKAQGKYNVALEKYRVLYARRRDTWGPDDLATLYPHYHVASILNDLGQYREALKILEDIHNKLGPDHQFSSIILTEIADVHSNQGDWEVALEEFEKVYERRKNILGSTHLATISTLHNIAATLNKLGKSEEAVQIMRDCHQKRAKILGPDHPDTLCCLSNIGAILLSENEYYKALDCFDGICEKLERALGPDHPETLRALMHKAGSLDQLSAHLGIPERNEALVIYRKICPKIEVIFGANHKNTLTTLNNYAVGLYNANRKGEACQIFRQIYEKRKMLLGADHRDTLFIRYKLAEIFFEQGQYKEALPLFVDVCKKFSGQSGRSIEYALSESSKYIGLIHDRLGLRGSPSLCRFL